MSRRKGERPVARPLQRWSDDHPVAHAMRTGSDWFTAWQGQAAMPDYRLVSTTGIPIGRIEAIRRGDYLTRAEADALARAWSVSTEDLIASMDAPGRVID